MGLNPNTSPTLLDVIARTAPNGNLHDVVEIMTEYGEILQDMPWIEGNLPTGHKTTMRSGLPQGTWRQLNSGVQPEKSTVVSTTDATGMLESYSEVDKDLVKLNGNTAAFRLSEDKAFIQGMTNNFMQTLFYGNTAENGAKFIGLAPRFNQLGLGVGSTSEQIIDAGGTGTDNTSIWLVVWGDNSVHGIYPKGSTGGLHVQDLGEQTLFDPNGGRYQGFRTHYKMDAGISVRNHKQIVRIANIDVSDLKKDASTGADIIDLMVQALELVEDLGAGRPVFYMGRSLRGMLRRQMMNKDNVNLSLSDIAGKKVLMFDEVPVRRVDAITSAESRVVA